MKRDLQKDLDPHSLSIIVKKGKLPRYSQIGNFPGLDHPWSRSANDNWTLEIGSPAADNKIIISGQLGLLPRMQFHDSFVTERCSNNEVGCPPVVAHHRPIRENNDSRGRNSPRTSHYLQPLGKVEYIASSESDPTKWHLLYVVFPLSLVLVLPTEKLNQNKIEKNWKSKLNVKVSLYELEMFSRCDGEIHLWRRWHVRHVCGI